MRYIQKSKESPIQFEKWKEANALQDELEEMIFVKQFFWNTLPIKL